MLVLKSNQVSKMFTFWIVSLNMIQTLNAILATHCI